MSTERKMKPQDLRSRKWFNNPEDPEMTAPYLERYLNYGLTREELQSGKPIIGIAQTGSDLSPCNRHHLELTKRVRDGVIAAGGTCIEVPVHPIQETGKRPTAMLDRNLAYLSLVETLFGYPLDGVVLNIGCDKTTPALRWAAAGRRRRVRTAPEPWRKPCRPRMHGRGRKTDRQATSRRWDFVRWKVVVTSARLRLDLGLILESPGGPPTLRPG